MKKLKALLIDLIIIILIASFLLLLLNIYNKRVESTKDSTEHSIKIFD